MCEGVDRCDDWVVLADEMILSKTRWIDARLESNTPGFE